MVHGCPLGPTPRFLAFHRMPFRVGLSERGPRLLPSRASQECRTPAGTLRGSAALREGRLGRGLREGDGASSKIRTSARASDGGSGWGLRGWGFPRSAQGLMAEAAVSPLGGGRHRAAQGEGRREGPRSPRDALRRRFPPRLSSETPVTGITERTRHPVSSLPGRTAQNLRRPYRFLSTDRPPPSRQHGIQISIPSFTLELLWGTFLRDTRGGNSSFWRVVDAVPS